MDRNPGKQQPDSAPTTMAQARDTAYIPQRLVNTINTDTI